MSQRKHPGAPHAELPSLSRRSLLRGAAMVPLVGAVSRCDTDPNPSTPDFDRLPATRDGDLVMAQLPRGASAVEKVAEHLDFSWLRPGDSVLLKVASNSNRQHPATTHPEGIVGMVNVLKARGAGRIIVADQAGIEYVRYRREGQLSGRTTRDMFNTNGIGEAAGRAGAEIHVFDEAPFETGYFAATPPAISHWKNGIFIPEIVNQVDHVVYLPRISAHAVTGYTMALKIAVGWMRDDTRLEFHQKGASVYEKFTEVSWVKEIKDRLRLTLTYVESLQLDVGPDFGTVVPLPEALVVASTHAADHDVLTSQLLMAVDDITPSPLDLLPVYPELADYFNHYLVEYWGADATAGYEAFTPSSWWHGVRWDPAVRHAYILDGVRPRSLRVRTLGTPLPPPVQQPLLGYDGGLFRFQPA